MYRHNNICSSPNYSDAFSESNNYDNDSIHSLDSELPDDHIVLTDNNNFSCDSKMCSCSDCHKEVPSDDLVVSNSSVCDCLDCKDNCNVTVPSSTEKTSTLSLENTVPITNTNILNPVIVDEPSDVVPDNKTKIINSKNQASGKQQFKIVIIQNNEWDDDDIFDIGHNNKHQNEHDIKNNVKNENNVVNNIKNDNIGDAIKNNIENDVVENNEVKCDDRKINTAITETNLLIQYEKIHDINKKPHNRKVKSEDKETKIKKWINSTDHNITIIKKFIKKINMCVATYVKLLKEICTIIKKSDENNIGDKSSVQYDVITNISIFVKELETIMNTFKYNGSHIFNEKSNNTKFLICDKFEYNDEIIIKKMSVLIKTMETSMGHFEISKTCDKKQLYFFFRSELKKTIKYHTYILNCLEHILDKEKYLSIKLILFESKNIDFSNN